ncbi:MAG: helix-turn-helix domain-containing protein [Haloechinothrix sp.]
MIAPVTPEQLAEARRALGRKLADRREAAGLIQAQLARLSGYSRSAVANTETGRSAQPRTAWVRYDQLLSADGAMLGDYDDYAALTVRQRAYAAEERERQRTAKINQWPRAVLGGYSIRSGRQPRRRGSVHPDVVRVPADCGNSVPVLEWPVLYGVGLARLIATVDNWLGASAPAEALQDLLQQELSVFDATASDDRDPVRVVSRRQALVALAALPATFAATAGVAGTPAAAATDRFLSQCAASITACWHLLKGCDLHVVDHVLSSYLLELDGIARRHSAHQQTAARLASQAHRICGIIALHRNQLAARERHCEQAFYYAQVASDVNCETAALVSLASTFFYRGEAARAASVYERALTYGQPGLTPLQYSRVHAELAAVYGQLGREQDALRAIALAEQCYPSDPEHDRSFLYAEFTRGSLALEQGLAYAALAERHPARGHQRRAAEVFAVVEQAAPGTVPDRIRFEIANHQARTAVLLNDFEAFETYMYRGIDGVIQLESRQRQREFRAAWKQAAEAWPNERRLDMLGQRLPTA